MVFEWLSVTPILLLHVSRTMRNSIPLLWVTELLDAMYPHMILEGRFSLGSDNRAEFNDDACSGLHMVR